MHFPLLHLKQVSQVTLYQDTLRDGRKGTGSKGWKVTGDLQWWSLSQMWKFTDGWASCASVLQMTNGGCFLQTQNTETIDVVKTELWQKLGLLWWVLFQCFEYIKIQISFPVSTVYNEVIYDSCSSCVFFLCWGKLKKISSQEPRRKAKQTSPHALIYSFIWDDEA